MKRVLPFLMMLPAVALSYACSSGSSNEGNGSETTTPSDPGTGGSTTPSDPNAPGQPTAPVSTDVNPIDKIAPAAVVLDTGVYTDGPIWDAKQQVIYFTAPYGQPGLYRMKEDGSAVKVRDADPSGVQIGNTIDKTGLLVTMEAKRITRSNGGDSAAPTIIATGFSAGTDPAPTPFDTLNDGVFAGNGSLYVTDPGYFGTPVANKIYRVEASGKVTVLDQFEDITHPNGIAFSPDQKTLYVGFTSPPPGTNPFIRKYTVNADGTLGAQAKFADTGAADSTPDGLEVDKAGNVYVATSTGVQVWKSDGTKIGVIAVPEVPTAMAFGGKDLQDLYITTQGTKIFKVRVNVAGIVQ